MRDNIIEMLLTKKTCCHIQKLEFGLQNSCVSRVKVSLMLTENHLFLSLGGTVFTIVLPTQMHFSKVIS